MSISLPDEQDERRFQAARDRLTAEYERWCRSNGHDPDLRADVELFLDWRWQYSAGELERFDASDLLEYLLEWCPRKLSFPPEAWLGIPRAVTSYLQFLGSSGRLPGGTASAHRLATVVTDATPEFLDNMADPAKHGMAKSVLARAGLTLVDLDPLDPSGIQAAMDRFNALPFEERKAITDQFIEPRGHEPDPIELPALLPPLPADVARSAAEAPLLHTLATLRSFLGNGRALTATGNLKVADGRALVDLLQTGDLLDIEGVRAVRSSGDLPRLVFLLRWAMEVRAVRVVKGRMVPVKAWATRTPLEQAAAAVATLLELGPLSAGFRSFGWFGHLHAFLDDGVPHLLLPALVEGGEQSVDELVDFVSHAVEHGCPAVPDWYIGDEERLQKLVADDVGRILELLEQAGVVTWTGWDAVPDRWGLRDHRSGGVYSLTALGRHVLPAILERDGYRISTIKDLAELDGLGFVRATLEVGEDRVDELWAQWRPEQTDAERAGALAEALLSADTPGQRVVTLGLLDRVEREALPVMRGLLDGPRAGHAALWLLEHDLALPPELDPVLAMAPLVDVLAWSLEAGEDELVAAFDHGAPEGNECDLLDALWRVDEPETIQVLEALGRRHPDKRIAKTARKAVIRHRSWIANRSR